MQSPVHLVGSIPMLNCETVFRTMASQLGPWLHRLPDGETGERGKWIYWQREMLLSHPDMEIDPDSELLPIYQWDGKLIRETELLRFRSGVEPISVRFETGYAEAALHSYEIFTALKDDGTIPNNVLFQVSLPTPIASGYMYVSPTSIDDYLPVYETALLKALNTILEEIPHESLSIQWDVCQEILIFEDYFPYRPVDYKDQIFQQLGRLGSEVPSDVDLGFHLCYGTPQNEHLVMPKDTGVLVEMANGVLSQLERDINFFHIPVPADRVDDEYYAPLAQLDLKQDTELYLGLIHPEDPEGDTQRMRAANKVAQSFGIASECGWGRTNYDQVQGLIQSHRIAALKSKELLESPKA